MTPSDVPPAELQEYAGQGRSRGSKVPRAFLKGQGTKNPSVLLADEQEPEAATPPAAEPAVVEVAPVGVAGEHRDILVVVEHGEGAESHDPPLPLQLGVGFGEGAGLLLRGGAVALLVGAGDGLLALDLIVEVEESHHTVAIGLVDLGARAVLLPRATIKEDGDATFAGELLALQFGLGWVRAVVDRDEVLALEEHDHCLVDDEIEHLVDEPRLLDEPPEMIDRSSPLTQGDHDDPHQLEHEPDDREKRFDVPFLLVLPHGIPLLSGLPLTPTQCRGLRLADPESLSKILGF